MRADDAIKNRKTQKILKVEASENESNSESVREMINDMLDLAAHAPYHKKCHEIYSQESKELNSCVPWRFYTLDRENCRLLLNYINENDIKAGKIGDMLSAADALLMVTWLPDPTEKDSTLNNQEKEAIPFNGNMKNMEHIAAASAAIQNVLIGATARGIPNYWSSGGQLRNQQIREYLKVSLEEILLGAIFLFPEDAMERNAIVKEGALRDQGKEKSNWNKWLELTNMN